MALPENAFGVGIITCAQFSLTDSPSPIAARTLILVAKSVQNLANLVEFGAKVKTFWYFKMSFTKETLRW